MSGFYGGWYGETAAPSSGSGGGEVIVTTGSQLVAIPLAVSGEQRIYLKAGDRSPARAVQLVDGDEQPIDLTGKTVTYRLKKVGASGYAVDRAAIVVAAEFGFVRYDWQAGDTDVLGMYRETWDDGTATYPSEGAIVVKIEAA